MTEWEGAGMAVVGARVMTVVGARVWRWWGGGDGGGGARSVPPPAAGGYRPASHSTAPGAMLKSLALPS